LDNSVLRTTEAYLKYLNRRMCHRNDFLYL